MDPTDRRVVDWMADSFASVEPGERLDLVDDVMQLGRIRHLPVTEGGALVGVVSQRDLLAAGLSRTLDVGESDRRVFLRSILVDDVMTRDPVTVLPDATLRQAARLLLRHKIGCLPVVTASGKLRGLLTETDLLRGVYGEDEAEAEAGSTSA